MPNFHVACHPEFHFRYSPLRFILLWLSLRPVGSIPPLHLRVGFVPRFSGRVVLCWIPSHIGKTSNEKADQAAKSSLELDVRPLNIPFKDFLPRATKYYPDLWQSSWERSTDVLTLIHPELKKKVYDPSLTRREQRALCRIRIGHSRLTHSYRMEKNTEKPKCDECNRRLSIKHIMVDCPKFHQERHHFLDGTTTEEIFDNSDRAIINFARESGFLNLL